MQKIGHQNGDLTIVLLPHGLIHGIRCIAGGVRPGKDFFPQFRRYGKVLVAVVFFNFCKLLDFYYGKDFFLDAALPDEVRNDKVDRAVSKIDFLTRNGLDKDMARKLARLLDDEELKHPRTVEQQKKLNAALNRLVQNLSSKNEKLAAQS